MHQAPLSKGVLYTLRIPKFFGVPMPFNQAMFAQATVQSQRIFNRYVYRTTDTIEQVTVPGYFAECQFAEIDGPDSNGWGWRGGVVDCQCSDGFATVQIDQATSTAVVLDMPGKLPGDYSYSVNGAGQLELLRGTEKVSMQSPDGSWFNDSVSTGVGSLHLGGSESGGMAHSLSSAGQNVGFKNEFSVAAESGKMFFYPPWQAVSVDGLSRVAPSYREYGARSTTVTPNGTLAAGEVLYNFPLVASSNSEVYRVTVYPNESYVGKLRNEILSNVTGAEIYDTTVQVTAVAGQALNIDYKYPFSIRTGDNLQLRIVKEDGTYLKVRAGSANSSQPFRQLISAPFTDRIITSASVGDVKHSYRTTDHDGWVYMDGRNVSTLTASQRANLVAAGINWSIIPATQDRVVVASGGNFGLGSTGGSLTIARSALPNFTLTGDTNDTNTDHTHGVGSLTVPSGGDHNHTYQYWAPSNGGNSASGSGVWSYWSFQQVTGQNTGGTGAHTHTITGSTASANSNTTHKHPYTTQSINGGVTQTWHTQPYVSLPQFVFVGL